MLAIVLAGLVGFRFLSLSALPEVDYPDHPGDDALSGRQPRGDEPDGDGAAGTPVRRDAGADAHGFDQFGRRLGHHAPVRADRRPRRRRAGGAGGDQRLDRAAPGRSARAAGLCEGQPGRRADHDDRDHFQDDPADASAVDRRHAACAEDQPDQRRRPRRPGGRAEAGDAHPRRYAGAVELRPVAGAAPHRDRQRQCQQRQGQLRRRRTDPTRSTPTTSSRPSTTTRI